MAGRVIAPSRIERASRLQRRGSQSNVRGRPADAATDLRAALRLLGIPDHGLTRDQWRSLPAEQAVVAVETLKSMALAEGELLGFEQGWSTLGKAQLAVEAIDAPAQRIDVANQRAVLLLRTGRDALALAELDAAESWLESAPAVVHCRVLVNRSLIHIGRGELETARRDLRECIAIAAAAGETDHHAKAVHNLGYLEFLAGDLPLALQTMDRADALGAPVIAGVVLLDRARVLVEAGLRREADDALVQAAALLKRDRYAQDLAEVDVSRAECALLAGDPAAARRFAARARDRFRRRGNDRWRRTAELVLLQGDLAVGRPGARLAPVALRLEAELRADGLPVRARTAALVAAEALLEAGKPAEAREIAGVRGRGKASDPITVRLHSRYVAARLDLAAGDQVAARRHVRAGLRELAGYQSGFGGIDLRTASAIHGRPLAELDLSLAVEGGRPAAVLAAVERGRAVSSRLPTVHPPADEQAAELLAELRQVVESIRAAQSDATQLQRRRHELERKIAVQSWTLAGGGEVRRAADLAEVREAVTAAGATLVAYVHTGRRLSALTVNARRSRLVHLGDFAAMEGLVRKARADFDVLAYERLPGGLRAAAAGSLHRSLEALDGVLLAPLEVTDQRLVVVPTGILGALAWSSLPSRQDTPVVVAPSATAWLAARSSPSKGATHVVALAGPDLARAAHEVTSIAKAWPSTAVETISGREALRAALASATVVHVAAHGQHQTENPLFSSIRLEDGPLFAHELDHTAPHVVLSACELGVATIRPGDEALGLTSVLLHLGTRSVVSGVARVGDEAAAEAMIVYHQLLAAGRSSDESLATALARSRAPLPFVCFGASWTS